MKFPKTYQTEVCTGHIKRLAIVSKVGRIEIDGNRGGPGKKWKNF